MRPIRLLVIGAAIPSAAALTPLAAQVPPATPPTQNPPAQQQPGATPPQGGQNPQPRRPRPYNQVITDRAKTERGGVTVHRVDDRYYFEIPDSLLNRDILLVSRVAAVPTGFGGFSFAGDEVARRVVRWEKVNDRLNLRSIRFAAVADD
jgi:hypothetical protein